MTPQEELQKIIDSDTILLESHKLAVVTIEKRIEKSKELLKKYDELDKFRADAEETISKLKTVNALQ